MTLNHLILIGGGHTNALLLKKWSMNPKLMPEIPISIISRDSHLVYSAMFPSVIAKSISMDDCLIDIRNLARNAKVNFIQEEVKNINFELKKIIFKNRPSIYYSNLVLNCGSQTKISEEFEDLVKNQIAFPIKPFSLAFEFIKKQDKYDLEEEPPFVVIGSGLAAVEVVFALRKRWKKRSLKIVCNLKKINPLILEKLRLSNIVLDEKYTSENGKILLCTGNAAPEWIQNNILDLDSSGRVITNQYLKLKNFSEIYAIGDCAIIDSVKRPASGIFAVKVLDTLVNNLKKDIEGKSLTRWFPQSFGLQIVNSFSKSKKMAFAIYGKSIFGPSFFIWLFKNRIDRDFIKKFRQEKVMMFEKKKEKRMDDCRGCAAKLPQSVLNNSLINAKLEKFATSPEDSVEIYSNGEDIILQSVDGFPSLLSDPWLNAKITTLHACSDLWACGAKILSAQAVISLPKVEKDFQDFLFSQSLEGIKSTVEKEGGKLIGGHTFESRSIVSQPYSLGIDISLTVQGVLKNGTKPWLKSGMQVGDILLMSRPLGVGIYFAGLMQGKNFQDNSAKIMKDLVTSQQYLIDEIYFLQEQYGESFINAATDITGYGFMGHLKEMVESSNLFRKQSKLSSIKVLLDIFAFKAYPGVLDLIRKKIKSTLFESNKEIIYKIFQEDWNDRIIAFFKEDSIDKKTMFEIMSLLLDPQTCGPLLISCDPKYESILRRNWYKVGEVVKR